MFSLLVKLASPDFGDTEASGLTSSLAGALLIVSTEAASMTVVSNVSLVLLSPSGGFTGLKLKLNRAE